MATPANERFFEEQARAAEAMALDGGIYLGEEPERIEPSAPAKATRRTLATVDLETIEMRDPEWLLRGFVPAGELTLLVGNGGVGKGSWSALFAAAVTRGRGECQNGEPGVVLWASAEDSIASVPGRGWSSPRGRIMLSGRGWRAERHALARVPSSALR